MMTSAQVVETSVNVTSNSPSQDYTHPDDHNLRNYGNYSVGNGGSYPGVCVCVCVCGGGGGFSSDIWDRA